MRLGLVGSRAEAQEAIAAGLVVVAGVPVPKPATMVGADANVKLASPPRRFVSRGGLKLDGALDQFGVAVAGRRAIDVGASTGGFTDCLLTRGAATVVAVDVGYGQLDWSLQSDERVTVVDRTNIRHADPAELGAPFDVLVADLSFISLRTVAPVLRALVGGDADAVVLVKPQFEVGKSQVGKGGIVRDVEARVRALSDVAATFASVGLCTVASMTSPITGTKGNVEYLLHLRPAGDQQPCPDPASVIAAVAAKDGT